MGADRADLRQNLPVFFRFPFQPLQQCICHSQLRRHFLCHPVIHAVGLIQLRLLPLQIQFCPQQVIVFLQPLLGFLQPVLQHMDLGNIVLPQGMTANDRLAAQKRAAHFHGSLPCGLHLFQRQRTGRCRRIPHMIGIVHDLHGCCGNLKQLIIIRIDRNQTTLDGAFQQSSNDQAVNGRQIQIPEDIQTILCPEHNGKSQHQQWQTLHLSAARDSTLPNQGNHEIHTQRNKPRHDQKVQQPIAVDGVIPEKTFRKFKHQLMQVIGKHSQNKQACRNIQIVHPSGRTIPFRFADIVHNEHTEQRHHHHGDVVAVPDVSSQCVVIGHGIFKFAVPHKQPKGQQCTHANHQFAHLHMDDARMQRNTPCQQHGENDHIPQRIQKRREYRSCRSCFREHDM